MGWGAWVPLSLPLVWPEHPHRAAAAPPWVPWELQSPACGHQDTDFSPHQHFPVSDPWTARPPREICLVCCVCNQGFDCLDFWVNTTACAPLFGYCYFTCMVLANKHPYIWLQCKTIRNQAESSIFSLDLSYSFLLTHLLLFASSHSLSSNHIWSFFFSTVSCLISFYKNMCTLTLSITTTIPAVWALIFLSLNLWTILKIQDLLQLFQELLTDRWQWFQRK